MERKYDVSGKPDPQLKRPAPISTPKTVNPLTDRRVQIALVAVALVAVLFSVAYSSGIVGGSREVSPQTLRTREKNKQEASGNDSDSAEAGSQPTRFK